MTSRILSTGILIDDDPRRVGRDIAARRGQRVAHLVEDEQPSGPGLGQRRAHDLRRDAGDLDVHLQRGDAFGRAGDLEVHVAVVIFGAGDVGEDRELAGLLVDDQPHRHAGHRRLDRDARVHHRQTAAADRGHRRAAVRFEDVGHDANRVRERRFLGDDGRQRALGQRAMADLTTARSAHELHFADRERREVVVEHEALPHLAVDHFDLLLVVGGAERRGDERLRLAAGEDDRAVHARQDARLDPDRPDLVELAAVEADAALEHLVAQNLLLQALEDALRLALALRVFLAERLRSASSGLRRPCRSSRACP